MKKTTILLGAFAILMAACSDGGSFKKTRSGMMYKISSDGKGSPAKRGNILKLHFSQRLKGTNKDTLLGETYGKMPYYAPVDSVGPIYSPVEIFPLLRKGDSATVILLLDTLAKRPGAQLPPFMTKKDKIVIGLKVVDVFTADSLAQKDQALEGQKDQARQEAEQKKAAEEGEKLKAPASKAIEDYLSKEKLTYQKTPGGTYVVIKEQGTGAQCENGKLVAIKYTGKLFPSGKQFESNMDGSRPPYEFQLGTSSVIPGWDEGLLFFKKGGKGTLYIPFFQAYGDRPGPGKTPHESLTFDIEVADVKDAPAPQPAPGAAQQGQVPPPPPPAQKKKP